MAAGMTPSAMMMGIFEMTAGPSIISFRIDA